MKKIILISLATVTFFAISCNNNENANTTTKPIEETSNNNNITTLNEATSNNDNAITAVTEAPLAIENPYANLKGNNPAHGQPNHRCDIPEGAPLNTPPQNATPTSNTPAPQPISTPTPQAIPVQNQIPAQTTAPGFSGKPNPAHGEPGHRCDLEVGQILP